MSFLQVPFRISRRALPKKKQYIWWNENNSLIWKVTCWSVATRGISDSGVSTTAKCISPTSFWDSCQLASPKDLRWYLRKNADLRCPRDVQAIFCSPPNPHEASTWYSFRNCRNITGNEKRENTFWCKTPKLNSSTFPEIRQFWWFWWIYSGVPVRGLQFIQNI